MVFGYDSWAMILGLWSCSTSLKGRRRCFVPCNFPFCAAFLFVENRRAELQEALIFRHFLTFSGARRCIATPASVAAGVRTKIERGRYEGQTHRPFLF